MAKDPVDIYTRSSAFSAYVANSHRRLVASLGSGPVRHDRILMGGKGEYMYQVAAPQLLNGHARPPDPVPRCDSDAIQGGAIRP